MLFIWHVLWNYITLQWRIATMLLQIANHQWSKFTGQEKLASVPSGGPAAAAAPAAGASAAAPAEGKSKSQ